MIWRFQRSISYRLLAWSALSLLAGAWLGLTGSGFERAFGLQAGLWGAIDAGIALFGLRGLAGKLARAFDPLQSEHDRANLSKILWLNSGLDLLYISGGLILALSLGREHVFSAGSGWGVVLQGTFLLCFDLLHALAIPREVYLPELGLFPGDEHEPFELSGGPDPRGTVVLVHGFPGTPVEMRALGEQLSAAGWRVRGMLLPGFGKQLTGLFQQRAGLWSEAIAAELRAARGRGGTVILAGFSMGAGLSIPAAVAARPDGLVLVAPFWFDLNPLTLGLLGLVGLFLPEHFNPFRLVPFQRVETSPAFSPPPGRLYPPAPEFFRGMKDVRLPLLFLEQFVALSLRAKAGAPRLGMFVRVLQGSQDRVVRPSLTRKLVKRIGPLASYLEIPGEHHVVMPDSPSFPLVCAEISAFARSIAELQAQSRK